MSKTHVDNPGADLVNVTVRFQHHTGADVHVLEHEKLSRLQFSAYIGRVDSCAGGFVVVEDATGVVVWRHQRERGGLGI